MASLAWRAPLEGSSVVISNGSDFIVEEDSTRVLPHNSRGPHLVRPDILHRVTAASRLEVRPAIETVSCGIPEFDRLTGGLPRGSLTEICGAASSGRTSFLLAALAAATKRQEACALVDANNALHPSSAAAAGVNSTRLLWVRCGDRSSSRPPSTTSRTRSATGKNRDEQEYPLEQALRVTDLLLQSGGFGVVAMDLGDMPGEIARRIPLASWFRFRRAVENTPAVLLVIEQQPIAGSCSSLLIRLEGQTAQKMSAFSHQLSAVSFHFSTQGVSNCGSRQEPGDTDKGIIPVRKTNSAAPSHAQLLCGLSVTAEVLRSRLERKSVRSAAGFKSQTAWTG
jgi:RecA DNA recombination protein